MPRLILATALTVAFSFSAQAALTAYGQAPALPWNCAQVRAFIVSHSQEDVQALAARLTKRQRQAVMVCIKDKA